MNLSYCCFCMFVLFGVLLFGYFCWVGVVDVVLEIEDKKGIFGIVLVIDLMFEILY